MYVYSGSPVPNRLIPSPYKIIPEASAVLPGLADTEPMVGVRPQSDRASWLSRSSWLLTLWAWWEDWTSSSSSPSPHTSRPRLSWRTSNTTMRSLRTPSQGETWRKLANFGSHPLDPHPHLTPSSLKGKKRNFIYCSNLTCISQADSGKNRSQALSRETSEIHKNPIWPTGQGIRRFQKN